MVVTALADFPHIYRLTKEFNDQYFGIPLNGEKLERWFELVVEHGVIYHTDGGYIAGLVVDDPVRDWTALVENAWYARDRSGLRLLRKFIQHGRDIGADEIRMTTLNTTPPGVLTLLGRTGFEEIERSHRLIL